MEAHYGIAVAGFSHNKAAFPSGFISPAIRLDVEKRRISCNLYGVCENVERDHESREFKASKVNDLHGY